MTNRCPTCLGAPCDNFICSICKRHTCSQGCAKGCPAANYADAVENFRQDLQREGKRLETRVLDAMAEVKNQGHEPTLSRVVEALQRGKHG